MDLDKLMHIEPDALDVEWLEQAGRFMVVSKEASRLKKELSLMREEADVLEANMTNRIRRHPAKYGMEDRVTEGGIKAAVTANEEVRTLAGKIIDKQYELDLVQSAVRAMEHRKQALEELVQLHGQQYFAGPKDPRDLNLEAAKRGLQQEARQKVKESRRTK
jgi:hypothetical protein